MAIKVDWIALRVEYVNGTMALTDLAAKHSVPVSSVEKHCSREGWRDERARLSAKVRESATKSVAKTRTAQLKEWNENDLRIAKALRSKVASRISNLNEDSSAFTGQLRALASAAESAQRLARLALGATTQNTGLSDIEGNPINPPRLGDFYESLAAYRESPDAKSGE